LASVVIDGEGRAIYVADIICRSDVIKLHIDLFADAPFGQRFSPATAARPHRR
jgi:hypothetical protein